MRFKWAGTTVLSDQMLSPSGSKPEQTQMQILGHDVHYGDEGDDSGGESARFQDDESETASLYPSGKPRWTVFKGILYSSLSSLFFSLCSAIVKYLDDIHPGELAVFRFVGILALTIPMVVRSGEKFLGPPHLRHLLVLRGLAGATSLFLRFCAFRYLPIADASVIIFSVPVFVSVFACLALKEPCGFFQTLSVALTMIGLALTTKLPLLFIAAPVESSYATTLASVSALNTSTSSPSVSASQHLSPEHLFGVGAAITSTFFAASVYIVIRKCKACHHSVIMFNFGWVATLETVIITFLLGGFSMPQRQVEWVLILVLAVFSFAGQVLLTRSLQLEAAGPVAVVRAATDIVLAFVWQLWLFKEKPDAWSVSGACLVTLCVLLTSVRKWILALPEHSLLRQRLLFLL